MAPGTEAPQNRLPFAGLIEGCFGWGCSTLDDRRKHTTQLEAVELPIRLGFKPDRTVDLVFGHDEALGGA